MANIKSAKKHIRKTKRKTSINKYWKRRIKENLRSFNEAVEKESGKKKIEKLHAELKSVLDKASRKNTISKKRASRIKSKTAKKINK